MSIELLLLAKILERGADGELVNRRWLDGSLMCLKSCHCLLYSGCYLRLICKGNIGHRGSQRLILLGFL
jgi:hypothetical protein